MTVRIGLSNLGLSTYNCCNVFNSWADVYEISWDEQSKKVSKGMHCVCGLTMWW